MRTFLKSFSSEGDNLLKPGCAQSVVTEAQLGIALAFADSSFQGLNRPDEQGAVKEVQVVTDALRTGLDLEAELCFAS